MKSLFKKLSLMIAAAAIFFAGTANIYADDYDWDKEEMSHQRFVEIETGEDDGSEF